MNSKNLYRSLAAVTLSMLLLSIIVPFTLGTQAANAQNRRGEQGQAERVGGAQNPQAQQPTENMPELQTRQQFEAGVEPGVKCPKPPIDYVGGIPDNFGGGPDPVQLSPELASFLNGKPVSKFDEGGPNKIFGHSFRPRENCKVCAVQLTVKMKSEGDFYQNDKIYIYGKNIQASDLIWSGTIGAGGATTFSVYLPPLSIAKLNNHIFNNAPGHWINLAAQDDHSFDDVKLRVWYY